jgi:hypothetical protein
LAVLVLCLLWLLLLLLLVEQHLCSCRAERSEDLSARRVLMSAVRPVAAGLAARRASASVFLSLLAGRVQDGEHTQPGQLLQLAAQGERLVSAAHEEGEQCGQTDLLQLPACTCQRLLRKQQLRCYLINAASDRRRPRSFAVLLFLLVSIKFLDAPSGRRSSGPAGRI